MSERVGPRLALNLCPTHGFWAVSIDEGGGGQRVTPGKCCGRLDVIMEWNMTPGEWRELARAAEEAAETEEGY